MDINVNVRIELSEDSKSFVAGLIKGLASANQVPATSATEEPAKKAATPAQTVKKAKAAEPVKEAKAEEPVAQAAAPAVAEVTLDMLRLVVGEKAADHRDEIKAKLTEMGVAKVTLLPQEKWPGFYEYVKGL